jgi:hypothetical protein
MKPELDKIIEQLTRIADSLEGTNEIIKEIQRDGIPDRTKI